MVYVYNIYTNNKRVNSNFNNFIKICFIFTFIIYCFISISLEINYDINLSLSEIYDCTSSSCTGKFSSVIATSAISGTSSSFTIVNTTSSINTTYPNFTVNFSTVLVKFTTKNAKYCNDPLMKKGGYCSCSAWEDQESAVKNTYPGGLKYNYYFTYSYPTQCSVIHPDKYWINYQFSLQSTIIAAEISSAFYEVTGYIGLSDKHMPFVWNGLDSMKIEFADITLNFIPINTPKVNDMIGNYFFVSNKNNDMIRYVKFEEVNKIGERDLNKFCYFQWDGVTYPEYSYSEIYRMLDTFIEPNYKNWICDGKDSLITVTSKYRSVMSIFNNDQYYRPSLKFSGLDNSTRSSSVRSLNEVPTFDEKELATETYFNFIKNSLTYAGEIYATYESLTSSVIPFKTKKQPYCVIKDPTGGTKFYQMCVFTDAVGTYGLLGSVEPLLEDGFWLYKIRLTLSPSGYWSIPISNINSYDKTACEKMYPSVSYNCETVNGITYVPALILASYSTPFTLSDDKRMTSIDTITVYLGDYLNLTNVNPDEVLSTAYEDFTFDGYSFLTQNKKINRALDKPTDNVLGMYVRESGKSFDYLLNIYSTQKISSIPRICKGLVSSFYCDSKQITTHLVSGISINYACSENAGNIYLRSSDGREVVLNGMKNYQNYFFELKTGFIDLCEPGKTVLCSRYYACNGTATEDLWSFIAKLPGWFTTDTSFFGVLLNIVSYIVKWTLIILIFAAVIVVGANILWMLTWVLAIILGVLGIYNFPWIGEKISMILSYLSIFFSFLGYGWIFSFLQLIVDTIRKQRTVLDNKSSLSDIKSKNIDDGWAYVLQKKDL